MTREHKLALILGFALVLVVGVLVSDHISGSQRTVASSQSMDDPIRLIESEFGPGLGQQVRRSGDRVLAGLSDPPQDVPVGGDSSVIDELMSGVAKRIEEIRHAPPPSVQQTQTVRGDADASRPQSVPGELVLGGPSRTPAQTGGGDSDPAAGSSLPGSQPAAVVTHRVQPRESLWGIAERYYGDGKLAGDLARWNADRIGSGNSIQVGTDLIIPSRAELSGQPRPVRVAQNNQQQSGGAPSRPSTPPAVRTYVVKRGDVLSTISQRELGTVRRMNEILSLNADRISSADEIRVGMELRLPSS